MSTASVAPLELSELHYSERPGLAGLDWIGVAHVDFGESYEWDEFAVWYSPSADRYYWASGSGCSCNSFGDDLNSVGDFADGTKTDAIAAGNRFCDEDRYTKRPAEAVVLSQAIAAFRPGGSR